MHPKLTQLSTNTINIYSMSFQHGSVDDFLPPFIVINLANLANLQLSLVAEHECWDVVGSFLKSLKSKPEKFPTYA